MNEKLFSIISQLWGATMYHGEEEEEMVDDANKNKKIEQHKGLSSDKEEDFRHHPFGPFDASRGYVYMDRIGFRIPTKIATELGADAALSKKKRRPIQRSLTPHLDCCPDTILNNYRVSNNSNDNKTTIPAAKKWRPLQSFIALTDSVEPNTGGFEAVPGFHRKFSQWARNRKPTIVPPKKQKQQQQRTTPDHNNNNNNKSRPPTGTETTIIPPPCVGQFTPMRPNEDHDVLQRVRHVPCRAGSVVIWDHRIPHANSRRNDADASRAVVYASFLPDVEINRRYVAEQLKDYRTGRLPHDQWIETPGDDDDVTSQDEAERRDGVSLTASFTALERKLMGIDRWEQ